MIDKEFQLRGIGDPRLAVHAISALPAWLWSIDGTRIVWANPVGAEVFGASNATVLAEKIFGPADPHRRQIAQLAGKLPTSGAIRLERLRGFGASLGTLVTCACAQLEFAGGGHGILIAAAERAGRSMPLSERLQRLLEGMRMPVAAFTHDGRFVTATDAARPLLGFSELSEAGLDDARRDALAEGRAEALIGIGRVVLQRVGTGTDIGLVASITPTSVPAAEPPQMAEAEGPQRPPEADRPRPDYEQAAPSGEAPADFGLLDEFAEELALGEAAAAPSWLEEASPDVRRPPLRFMWRMDAQGRFSLGSDEFTRLMGARTAAAFGRPWREIAEAFGLDPEDRVLKAVSTRNTWNGITLNWPVDGGDSLPVELSALPIFDRAQNFAGYRGFGVCRDLDALARLAELRRYEFTAAALPKTSNGSSSAPDLPLPIAPELRQPTATVAETPKNVVPFRPIGETKSPVLTPVENHAFNELARQLSERLGREDGGAAEMPAAAGPNDEASPRPGPPEPAVQAPEWLAEPEPPARGEARRDKTLLDLLPVGVLIYRLDRLLYANTAFLERLGYASLHALEAAGGLDSLYVEPGVSSASSTSDMGTPVTISAGEASPKAAAEPGIDGRLYTISWDDDSALALIFAAAPQTTAAAATLPSPASEPSPVGHANAEELGAILDTTAEGIVMFDGAGNINACNRSAEALFGYDGDDLATRNLRELFAPESQQMVLDYLENINGAGVASLLEHGREVLGRTGRGGLIPLSMTMGRTQPGGPNFFAVFRDLSQSKKNESDLLQARRLADRAADAKADVLARISHEVRTPLNTIIGFAEVMVGERFGTLGNERYIEYLKDIRASGERVIAIINDLLDLSRIETGKLDLAFANHNLNQCVEECVAMMQPQANRERIVIRTSLAHTLPPVFADLRALRQITLNLITNSIHLADAAGQVIVSTALSDSGEVVLRVRDTGHGLSRDEVAATMEPFRTQPVSDQASGNSGVSLSLTKALVEANRAQFHIKTGPHPGTLIEVVFPHAMARG